MKKTNLILIILGILTLGIAVSAQEKGAANDFLPLETAIRSGRLPKNVVAELSKQAQKNPCTGTQPFVLIRNAQTGTTPSTELNAFMLLNTFNSTPRGYGVGGFDKWFIDTLPLGTCRICRAFLIADIARDGDASNDGFNMWLADPTPIVSGGQTRPGFIAVNSNGPNNLPNLWAPPAPASKFLFLDLNVSGDVSHNVTHPAGIPILNNYIISPVQTPALDMHIQDDTKVNALYLIVWR
jgi:hypothetical protein